MDLTAVRDVTGDDTIFDEAAYYDGVGSAHNIAINDDTGYAYVIGASSGTEDGCAGGLHMLDISDPASPDVRRLLQRSRLHPRHAVRGVRGAGRRLPGP